MVQKSTTNKNLTPRRLAFLKQQEIDRLFPLINIAKIKNIKPREFGTRSFRIQGCPQKGLQVHIRFLLDENGDRWSTCHVVSPSRSINQKDISFMIDNFFGYDIDVIQMIKHQGKKVDIANEVFLYANIDQSDIFEFKEEEENVDGV